MSHWFDDQAKKLAGATSRRDLLRRVGGLLGGGVLMSLGIGAAWAKKPGGGSGGGGSDPCKTFCSQCPRGTLRDQCLNACRACGGDTHRVCGSCGSMVCCSQPCCSGVCCPAGSGCCDGACTDMTQDPNCGACGRNCSAEGRTCCPATDGDWCKDTSSDPGHCGACGNVCPALAPVCIEGLCTCPAGWLVCGNECVDPMTHADHCGGCGNACTGFDEVCCDGVCTQLGTDQNCSQCGDACPTGSTCQFVEDPDARFEGDGWYTCV